MATDGFTGFPIRYVDAFRTHVVTAEVESGADGLALRITELPFGSDDPRDAIVRTERIKEAWEARLALRELEARLGAAGVAYFRERADADKVEQLPGLFVGGKHLAPRRVPIDDRPGLFIQFLHYRTPDGRDRIRVAFPRLDLDDDRYLVADFDFDFRDPEAGTLSLLHPRLASGPLRHLWACSYLDLPKDGYERLAADRDYGLAHGNNWRAHWQRLWTHIVPLLARAHEDDAPRADVPEAPPQTDAKAPARAADYVLTAPVVARIRMRYLPEGDPPDFRRRGLTAIRTFINERRERASPKEQLEIALLESVLLLEHARRHGLWEIEDDQRERVQRIVGLFEDDLTH